MCWYPVPESKTWWDPNEAKFPSSSPYSGNMTLSPCSRLLELNILLRLSQLNESSRCIISVHIIWNALSVVKHWTHNEANSGYSKSMQQLCSNFWNFETHLAIHQRLEVLAKRIALHKSRSSRELSLSRVSMKSKITNDIVLSWVYRREHSYSPGCGTKKTIIFFFPAWLWNSST